MAFHTPSSGRHTSRNNSDRSVSSAQDASHAHSLRASHRGEQGRSYHQPPRLAILLMLLMAILLPLFSYFFVFGSGSTARAASCDLVGGLILSDTTWSPASCDPYIVTGSIIVNEGVTLTVEAGTTVKFASHKAITVKGTIKVLGTASQPVYFTSNIGSNPGDWDYIYLTAESTDATYDSTTDEYLDGSTLQYAVIEYAGGSSADNKAALRMESSPYIDHTTVRYSNSTGIHAWNSGAPRLTNNTLSNNEGHGIRMVYNGDTTELLISGNTITGNDTSSSGGGLYVDAYKSWGNKNSVTIRDNTITDNNADYGGGIYLYSNGINTISGNTITGNYSNNRGGGINLWGNQGTSTISGNIINENTTDDDGGGIYADRGTNTIRDNTINENTAGDGIFDNGGGGIYLYNGSSEIIGNTISGNIAKGGRGGGGVNIDVSDSTYNALQDNTITGNIAGVNSASSHDGGGIYIYDGSPEISGNTIANNVVKGSDQAGGGMYIKDNNNPVINNNQIYGNTADLGSAIYNANTSSRPDIDATSNWWGASDQATIEAAVYHHVDAVSLGFVNYNNYLTEEPTSLAVSGDSIGYMDQSYTFDALVTPDSASTPIDYTWTATDQISVTHSNQLSRTDSAEFTWNSVGNKTIIVTATNAAGTVADSHTINIVELVPLSSVEISGPISGTTETDYSFTAVVDPANATLPLEYTWSPEPASGQGSNTADYSWSAGGEQSVSVEVTNPGGTVQDSHTITIQGPATPTSTPTPTPTNTSTPTPTPTSTGTPTSTPTGTPTSTPTGTPTSTPTGTPTSTSTGTPTSTPTGTPTSTPTGAPTSTPTSTPTPTTTSDSAICQRDIDMMLVLDGSNSIKSYPFRQMQDFASSVVDSFAVGTSGARIGIVQFSTGAELEIGLSNDVNAVRNAITTMSQKGGGTDIQDGLELARTEIASKRRDGVNPVIILLTDGDNRGDDPLDEAIMARNEGITIFAIAVGSGPDMQQIKAIATDPDNNHVFTVGDFNRLALILETLVKETCLVPTPTQTPTPIPNATDTPTPTPSTTPTPTPTPSAPIVRLVDPSEGYNDETTSLDILGGGFSTAPAPSVNLLNADGTVSALTNVKVVNNAILTADVPAGFAAASYDVQVTNPNGTTGILPNGFTVLARKPLVTQVLPAVGNNNRENTITVYGLNFADQAQVLLDTTPLNTTRLNGTLLQAIVPGGHPSDVYDVVVVNPNGQEGRLSDGYTLLDQSSNNDLTSSNTLMWFKPQVARVGEPVQLGVIVQRYGGKRVLENVTVRFTRDAETGTVLGESNIPFLDPPSSQESTMPLEVTFSEVGTFDIYAIIDPENEISESNEGNNVVMRSISVAPPSDDTTVPVVQSITINDGSSDPVRSPRVKVDVESYDPQPNASTVESVNIIEYLYNDGVQHWIPVATSGWLPYSMTPDTYQWELQTVPGIHYLQIRAVDSAANVSIGNARQPTNYEPSVDHINQGQTHVYRYNVAAGQQLQVDMEVMNGDADLYVWSSREDQSAWVSNQVSGDEQVIIPADKVEPGIYQVEIYGYSDADYRLLVSTPSTLSLAEKAIDALLIGGLAQDKNQPSEPVIPVASVPDEDQGIIPAVSMEPAVSDEQESVYLPLITR